MIPFSLSLYDPFLIVSLCYISHCLFMIPFSLSLYDPFLIVSYDPFLNVSFSPCDGVNDDIEITQETK
jgi:hypothetical protein